MLEHEYQELVQSADGNCASDCTLFVRRTCIPATSPPPAMWTCPCPHRPVRTAPCSENTVDELVEPGQLTLAAKGGILGHAPCVAIRGAAIATEIMGPDRDTNPGFRVAPVLYRRCDGSTARNGSPEWELVRYQDVVARGLKEDTSAPARTLLEPPHSHKSRLAPWDRAAGYRSENSRLTICVIPMVVT